MVYRVGITISPANLTDLTITNLDLPHIPPRTLENFTVSGDVLTGTLTYGFDTNVFRIESTGFVTQELTASELDEDPNVVLVPTYEISKIVNNGNTYTLKDSYAREQIKTLAPLGSVAQLLKYEWFDHIINDQSWLRADTFSWQSGTVYSNAYNHLVSDYNNAPKEMHWSPTITSINLDPYARIVKTPTGFYSLGRDGHAATSTDGINWTSLGQVLNTPNNLWLSLAYGNGTYIACSYDGANCTTSTDGINWTTPTHNIPKDYIDNLGYGDGKFICSQSTTYYISSDNGETWNGVDGTLSADILSSKILYGNNKFIVFKYTSQGIKTSVSSDGSTWSQVYTTQVNGNYNYSAVCFDNEQFVAVSSNGYMLKSIDGINWTETETTALDFTPFNLIFTNDRYVTTDSYLASISKSSYAQYETVGSYVIETYVTQDGHKIVTSDQEQTVLNIYTNYGVAWYYILDIANTRFKLPRSSHGNIIEKYKNEKEWYRVYSDGWCEQGGYVNTTATPTTVNLSKEYSNANYAIELTPSYNGNAYPATTNGTISTNSFQVRTPNANVDFYWQTKGYINSTLINSQYNHLYFYVGGYSQTALEQTSGLNTELFNEKMDLDMSNMNPSQTAKQTIVGFGIPDYTAGVTISSPYTATEHCFVSLIGHKQNASGDIIVSINGTQVSYFVNGNSNTQGYSSWFYLAKGDTITYSSTRGFDSQLVFPLKGVQNA